MKRDCWHCGQDFEDPVTLNRVSRHALDGNKDDVPTLCVACNEKTKR